MLAPPACIPYGRHSLPHRADEVKLHVCNLAIRTSHTQLGELFAQYGEVLEAFVLKRTNPTHRNCRSAFVRMAPVAAGVRAMRELDGAKWRGTTLRVRLSKYDQINDATHPDQSMMSVHPYGEGAQDATDPIQHQIAPAADDACAIGQDDAADFRMPSHHAAVSACWTATTQSQSSAMPFYEPSHYGAQLNDEESAPHPERGIFGPSRQQHHQSFPSTPGPLLSHSASSASAAHLDARHDAIAHKSPASTLASQSAAALHDNLIHNVNPQPPSAATGTREFDVSVCDVFDSQKQITDHDDDDGDNDDGRAFELFEYNKKRTNSLPDVRCFDRNKGHCQASQNGQPMASSAPTTYYVHSPYSWDWQA